MLFAAFPALAEESDFEQMPESNDTAHLAWLNGLQVTRSFGNGLFQPFSFQPFGSPGDTGTVSVSLINVNSFNVSGSGWNAFGDVIGRMTINGQDAFCLEPWILAGGTYTAGSTVSNAQTAQYLANFLASGKTDADYVATTILIWESLFGDVGFYSQVIQGTSFQSAYNSIKNASAPPVVVIEWSSSTGAQGIITLLTGEDYDVKDEEETRIEIETRVEVETTTTIENSLRYSEAWGQITIRKENQNHESLDGAQFDIRLEFSNGEVRNINNWEVDNSARLLTWQHPAAGSSGGGDISPVKVTVTEVRPPQHYSLDTIPQVAYIAPTYTTFFIQTTRMWTTEMSFHYHMVFHTGGGDDGGDGGDGGDGYAIAHSPIPIGAAPISSDGWAWLAATRDASDDGGEACPICSHEFGPTHNSAQVGSDTQETASMTVGDRETTLTFRSVRENGQINITKLCAVTGQPLAGAQFRVEGVDLGNAGSFNQTVTTGIDGTVTVNGLFPGSYLVTEIGAPPTHNLDAPPQTVALQSNETADLTFRNTRRQGLQILKVDPEGNSLQGAVFQVARGSGQNLGSYLTDENGLIVIPSNQLVTGEYVITEIKAPDGFLIDEANNPQRIYVDNTQQNQDYSLVFRNFRMPSIEIIKVAADNPAARLEGAVFRIINTRTGHYTDITTTADGIALLERLEIDATYIIEERKAPQGYLNTGFRQEIVLRENRVHTVTVSNTQLPELTVIKRDSATGNTLAGARFLIERLNAGNVTQIGEFTTNADGLIVLSLIEPGRYRLTEVEAPPGFIIEREVHEITLETGGYELTITNTPQSPIFIRKTDPGGRPLLGAEFLVTTMHGAMIGRVTTGHTG